MGRETYSRACGVGPGDRDVAQPVEKECPDDGGCTRRKRSRYLAASISVTRHFPMLSAMILTEADAVRVRCA